MREKLLMNRDWLYYFGEPDFNVPKPTSSDQTYRGSRGENARGPARRDFYDFNWRRINLPHDFVNENGPQPSSFLPGEKHCYPLDRGTAWYRRYFRVDEADRGKRITLLFDGVGLRCEVYVNSILMKLNLTAGIGFEVDITDLVRYGTDYNLVAVHADCTDFEAWYYEGGGIYRNVYLVKTDKLSVDLWGTYVRSRRVKNNTWDLDIDTEVRNDYYEEKKAWVVSKIVDPMGAMLAEIKSASESFRPQEVAIVKQSLQLENPKLWGTGSSSANLYKLLTEIVMDGVIVDNYETSFGIREIVYDKDHGMLLNGERCRIYGFANHQIHVGMGNAMSDSMREFQLRTIRDMGGNGFRMVHSPHGPYTYEICDKYGLLVMDENRIFHPSEYVQDEVKRMVKRCRNHPSIIMWSIYNEEDTVASYIGKNIFKRLANHARKFDNTRPMTGATSYGMWSEEAHDEDYDILGVNHQTAYFEGIHKIKPNLPLYCSESVSPVGPTSPFRPNMPPGVDALAYEKEFMVGNFHFTAWAFGTSRARVIACDGTPTGVAHGFRAYLKQNEPFAKIFPGWDFPGQEGKEVFLMLANNGDYVEVSVNGKFVAKVETNLYAVTPFSTNYEPGEIKIVAFKNGALWAEDTAYTPGEPAAIKLVMENLTLKADNDDVAIVSAYLVDAKGVWCHNAIGYQTMFSCNEAGEYVGSVTQRIDGFMGWHGPEMTFVYGKAQVFFRSMAVNGDLLITASCGELPKAEIVIKREMTGPVPAVPPVPNNFILDWQISKLYPYTIDEQKIMTGRQIELWEHIDTQGSPDILYGARDNRFTGTKGLYDDNVPLNYAYYTKTIVPDMGSKGSLKQFIHFEGFDGIANIHIVGANGKKATVSRYKNSPWPGHYLPVWYVNADIFEAGEEVEIWVFIHNAVRITGIGWPVHWTFKSQTEVDEYNVKEAREWDYHKYKSLARD
jgi:beta-galactosidase